MNPCTWSSALRLGAASPSLTRPPLRSSSSLRPLLDMRGRVRRLSAMQASNRLQTALMSEGRASMGAWQMVPGANIARVLARSGVDWVLVDCEHGNLDGK